MEASTPGFPAETHQPYLFGTLVRPVTAALIAAGLVVVPVLLAKQNPQDQQQVSILIEFEEDYSPIALREMKLELDQIMERSAFRFEFRFLRDVKPSETFAELIVAKFKGHCEMEFLTPLSIDRGALGFSHASDGSVLPFTDIQCDRVRDSIRPAMWGGELKRANLLLGRALGRVLAHEIYHILGRTTRHSSKGIAQSSLSGTDLICDELELTDRDLETMRRAGS